jgi:hypothetical protein
MSCLRRPDYQEKHNHRQNNNETFFHFNFLPSLAARHLFSFPLPSLILLRLRSKAVLVQSKIYNEDSLKMLTIFEKKGGIRASP